jgi:ABC-2 type transport system permease protein
MKNSAELTLARLAVRQLTSSKRSLWALVLALLPVLIAYPVGAEIANARDGVEDFVGFYQVLIVGVLLPIVALVVGTGIFGAEVEDGTITFVLGKPVARWRMVLARIVIAGLATAVVIAPATYAAGRIALRNVPSPPAGLVGACTAAVAIGGLLYCALFVALSLSTRRALVAGLAYVVIWEGVLTRTFAGSRGLSVREYTLSFAESMAKARPALEFARLDVGAAVPLAAALAVLATLYAIHRLRGFEIGEAA